MSPEPSAPAAQLATHPVAALRRPRRVDDGRRSARPLARRPRPSAAAVPPVGARWGTDIGWPQCGHALPDIDVDFTIIQVTAGRPGTVSSCLKEQVAWARSVRSVVNAYVVPGSPSAADLAAADRSGSCRGERSCRLRAAGAADAAHALAGAEAAGLDARGWWLDVEDVAARTLWGTDTDANTQVVIGWRDELRRAGKRVGVYSTRGYWRQVVGNWQADLPQWPAVGLAGVDAATAGMRPPVHQRAGADHPVADRATGRQPALPGPGPAGRVVLRALRPGPDRRPARPARHPGAPPRDRGRPQGPGRARGTAGRAGPAGQGRGRGRGEADQQTEAKATPVPAAPTRPRSTPAPPEPTAPRTPPPAEPAPSPTPSPVTTPPAPTPTVGADATGGRE